MRGDWRSITPAEVLTYDKPTEGFLCPLSANTYGVEFLEFEIKDYDTNKCVFKVSRDGDADVIPDHMLTREMEEAMRSVRYHFDAEFLTFKTVRTALKFCVGDKPVPNFRMIERHYFKDKLIRNYDFTFGFCIPFATNSWEAIYPMPTNTTSQVDEFVSPA
uniref:Gmp-delta subunit family protein n=1 Tax=Tetraselmis sp. GSL018 TaxID=582737 RepID=A0A061RMU5_9CHLO|eukprot:CAMPEP_0177619904 /NCGR_PEP_ID=MMETSP0419_2-20121207/26556_1 /TAXON_ID=582737 /ORGANISM="Tetraselmis sp., Strain GSL018" /LENGTH=160 /DNA_ID=CAMNT_0019119297 /DNA_START=141 /DNA_END=623 /DNA_ORIENTATION=-